MAGFGAEHRDAPAISSSREIWGGFPGPFTFVTTQHIPGWSQNPIFPYGWGMIKWVLLCSQDAAPRQMVFLCSRSPSSIHCFPPWKNMKVKIKVEL